MTPSLQLWLGAAVISFAPICVKAIATLGPTPIGFYRCLLAFGLLAAPALLPPARLRREARGLSWRPTLWGYLAAGLCFGVDLYVWHRSVLYAGAGLATILGNTQVFYLALAGILFYREPLRPRFLLAVGLAVAGILLLINPRYTPHPHYWPGVAYGLMTGIAYAGYLFCFRYLQSRGVRLPTLTNLAFICLSSSFFLALFCLLEGSLPLPGPGDWPALLALAGIVQIGGWWLISRNLPRVPVSRVGLILLTQPVGATLWGWLLYQEQLGPLQLFGGALTLGAIYLGTTRHKG